MSDYPDNPGPLPAEKFCNPKDPNPVTGDGALGNRGKGKMFYGGPDAEAQVKSVQAMLAALGYDVGNDEFYGIFGDDTERAVLEFQDKNKDWNGEPLKSDGLVGPGTADALNRRMVGKWYRRYDTPKALTGERLVVTVTHNELMNGTEVDMADSTDMTVITVEELVEAVTDDFLVLTKKDLNAESDFNVTDTIQIMQYSEGEEQEYKFQRNPMDVFIRSYVIVFGNFMCGHEGTVRLRVVDRDGKPKCDWKKYKLVNGPLRKKTVIPMGDESTCFTVAIIANPGYGKKGGGGPFTADEILKERLYFHFKVLYILQTFFDGVEDLFRDPEIEPHFKFITYFDDRLPADADHSLIYIDDTHIRPRCTYHRNLLPDFLKEIGLSADLVFAVSYLAKIQTAIGIVDGPNTGEFTYMGQKYHHGKDTVHPGFIADTVQPVYLSTADDIISMHEFFHAVTKREHCHIYDLYDDNFTRYMKTHIPINKMEKDDKDDAIPEDFGEYQGMTYKSDRPAGPGYKGRGGLGYGPNTPGKIEKTYGPELRDKSYPNIMDCYTDAGDPAKCKIDKLGYIHTKDRIKAKLK